MNDRALIYLWGFGFAARCIIASEPHKYKHGKYDAKICEIAPLAAAVPSAFIQKNHPSWKWLSAYTKSYTTIDGPIEARLSDVLESYQASFAEPLTEGAFKSVSVTAYERNALAHRQCIEHTEPPVMRADSLLAKPEKPPMGTFTFTISKRYRKEPVDT